MKYNLHYSAYGEHAILIEWPENIDENILDDITHFKNRISKYYTKVKVEVVSSYSSILIIYTTAIDVFNDEIKALKLLYSNLKRYTKDSSKLWNIPVCYDEEFGIDLKSFSEIKHLQKEEIIELHSQTIYSVYFIGFLPGFLYLGGLDSRLYLDRKITPNLNVKKGAIGIGGRQTGMYPQNSPGGWHIIGNSPINLFNPQEHPPCFISPGDKVKFKAISRLDYLDIKEKASAPEFSLKSEKYYD